MADIGLNPPGTRHDRVVGGVATVTGIKFGHVVLKDTATANFRDVKLPTGDGQKPVAGVCVSITDPSTGSAVGDNLEICEFGIPEVLLAPLQTIVKGDVLITAAAVAGTVKKLGAELTYDVVGRAHQNATSGADPILIAVEVGSPPQTV